MSADYILETQDLKKYFKLKGGKLLRAIDGISIALERGKTLGVVGESGCGKSTLGRTIIGVYEPTAGRILFDGAPVEARKSLASKRAFAAKAQMIFQDPYACLNPRMTVGDIVAEGWDIARKYRAGERREKILEMLALVGLNEEHAGRFPHEFSGGQRQRIGIARALSMESRLIICDEPISALDVSIQAQVMNLLCELQGRLGLSYLFIAHDLSMVRYISDHVAVMYLGSIMEYADSEEIYRNPQHPYTKALFSAIPPPNPDIAKSQKYIALEGEIPSPINAPAGCKFSSRCPQTAKVCKESPPEAREIAPGHTAACHLL